MSSKSHEMDLCSGSLWKKIFIYSVPLMFTNILQVLFNMSDVAVVGKFAGAIALGAVGSTSILVTLFTGILLGLASGVNALTALHIGSKDDEGLKRTVHTAVIICLAGGILITVFGILFSHNILALMNTKDELIDGAVLYLRIYLLGMPALGLYNFGNAVLSAAGDTKRPLYYLAFAGVVNVILNLFFVIVIGMTVNGVALATVISNGISSMLLFVFLLKGKTPLTIEKQRFRIHAELLKEMLQIGLPAGLQGMVFSISNILIQSAVNSLGTDVVAGSSAAGNLEIIGYFVVNSFSQACTTIIGQNFGANQPERCHKTLMISLVESWIVGGTVSFLIIIFGKQLLRLFNSDPNVIAFGYQRLFWILSFEVINGTIDIISGAMRGYGESLTPALIALVCICGVRIVYIFTYFASHRSFTTLMLAYPISWIITVIVISAAYLIMRKNGLGYQQETTLKDFKK